MPHRLRPILTVLSVLEASTAHITNRDSEQLRMYCAPQTDAERLLKKILDNKDLLPTLLQIDPDMDARIAMAIGERLWNGPATYHCYSEGFWVKVPAADEADIIDDWELSDSFKALIRFALTDYDWVKIDADGDLIPTLETHTW